MALRYCRIHAFSRSGLKNNQFRVDSKELTMRIVTSRITIKALNCIINYLIKKKNQVVKYTWIRQVEEIMNKEKWGKQKTSKMVDLYYINNCSKRKETKYSKTQKHPEKKTKPNCIWFKGDILYMTYKCWKYNDGKTNTV